MINDIGFYDLFLFCFVLCLNNLFPGISLISDLAYDSGMLQSESESGFGQIAEFRFLAAKAAL